MTDKLLIERELLERLTAYMRQRVCPAPSGKVATELHADLTAALAAPRQPEGEGLTRYNLFCSYDGGGPAEQDESPDGDYVLHSDAQRAIAELREECERLRAKHGDPAGSFEKCMQAIAERDTLRQQLAELDAAIEEWSGTAVQNGMECDRIAAQRDKLAGLLVQAQGMVNGATDEWHDAARTALAEVEKAR